MSHTRTPGRDRSSRSRLLPARIIPTYEHTVLSAALAQSEKTNCTPSLAKQQFGNRLIIRSHKQQCTPRVGSRSSHVRSEHVRSEQVRTFAADCSWPGQQTVSPGSVHALNGLCGLLLITTLIIDYFGPQWATMGHSGPRRAEPANKFALSPCP